MGNAVDGQKVKSLATVFGGAKPESAQKVSGRSHGTLRGGAGGFLPSCSPADSRFRRAEESLELAARWVFSRGY